jgi:hypothetical protein
MKHIAKMFYLALLCLVMQNCAEKDDTAPTKEKVQFSLDLKTIPEGSTLRLSIQKSTGESVLNLQEIELLQEGNTVTTALIDLPRGNYKVTDFHVVKENQISFATPKKGSPMAVQVSNPVDFDFSVQQGSISKIAMEVVNVANALPENFGYVTFDLNVIHPFKLIVSVPYQGGLKITNAKAFILQGADTVQKFNISPKVNILPFKEEPNQTCTLVIVKEGYARYSQDFIYDDLMTTLAGAPLKITLTEAFTFLAYAKPEDGPFSVALGGPTGKSFSIDWGDGSVENYGLNSYLTIEHNYPSNGNYPVSITGDINVIRFFYSYYGQGAIDEINLEHLTKLEDLTFGWTRSPKILDLTHNPNITFLNLSYLSDVKTINLPVKNKIRTIWVGGPSRLTAASLNDIISKVHKTATLANRHDGSFSFEKSWEFPDEMVNTPSPAALTMLRDLRDNYGWIITPDIN